MSARIINLRTRRKQKARADKQSMAAQQVAVGKVDRPVRADTRANEEARISRLEAHRKDEDD